MTYFRSFAALLGFATILLGCTTYGSVKPHLGGAVPKNDYSLAITDDVSNKRFELKLTMFVDRQSCVYFEDWPNKNGYLHFASERVFVTANSDKFPIKDRNMGYCTGGCYVTIPPNGSIESTIPYSEFEGDIPVSDGVERTLTYTVQPRFCS